MSSFTLYKELFPSTIVDHAVRANFTSSTKINLIIAKGSLLQVYDFVEIEETADFDQIAQIVEGKETELNKRFDKDDDQTFLFPILQPVDATTSLTTTTARLELVAEYKLNGNVMSMSTVRLPAGSTTRTGCDYLLVSAKDAKMSLLEWHVPTHSLQTVSLHYYEREELKKEYLANPYPPLIRVDPQNRCAILNFYGDKVSVLPFRQEETGLGSGIGEDQENATSWPYFPSFILDLHSIDEKIKNVIDMTFLHDYYEPTLAILFETTQTWTGRLQDIRDTVSLVIISLDLSPGNKNHTIIYTLDNLPYDCATLQSIPKPIGGMLVFCANTLLYVSQGSPSIGVALNGYAVKSTSFIGINFEKYKDLEIQLEGARSIMVDEELGKWIVILRSGMWLIIAAEMDGRNLVGLTVEKVNRKNHLIAGPEQVEEWSDEHVVGPVIPTCVVILKEMEYFFVGGRGGDALLVAFGWGAAGELVINQAKKSPPPSRSTQDLDMDLYGSSLQESDIHIDDYNANNVAAVSSSKMNISNFTYKICDTLLNTGPIADMAVGEVTLLDNEDDAQGKKDLRLELVTCSGFARGGGLCVFQRNIYPQITHSFNLPGCKDIWSLQCQKEYSYQGIKFEGDQVIQEASIDANNGTRFRGIPQPPPYDRYLLINKLDKTIVLAAGEELQELETTEFYSEGPTIAAGSLFHRTRIVQVYSSGFRVLDGDGKKIQEVPIGQEWNPVVFSSIVDPYVLLMFADGTLSVMEGNKESKKLAILTVPDAINDVPVISGCIYADESGLFSLVKNVTKLQVGPTLRKRKAVPISTSQRPFKRKHSDNMDIQHETDGEDMDLYGSSTPQEDKDWSEDEIIGASALNLDENITINAIESNVSDQNVYGHSITHWCIVYRTDGSLQIYSLPDLEEVFCCSKFNLSPSLVSDSAVRQSSGTTDALSPINEVLVSSIGKVKRDPYLIARTSTNDIIIYKTFQYVPNTESEPDIDYNNRLALRFTRIHHEYVSAHNPKSETSGVSQENVLIEKFTRGRYLLPFTNVEGYTGVFVAGPRPAWLICTGKSFVRVHPMRTRADVVAFTSFHNANCPLGFLFVDIKGNLYYSLLPKDNEVSYDMDWPIRKVPLELTVHKIVYHPTMQVYAAFVSTPEPYYLTDEEGNQIYTEQASGEFLPQVERYSMVLISPITWEVVDQLTFEETEQGLCLECVSLETKNTASGRKFFIAVGTGFQKGEDTAMRGRIYIFDVVEVVPEVDNPQTNHKFKMLHNEEVKGAVSALCAVDGYLLTAMGPKIFIRTFEDQENLAAVAFYDLQIYITKAIAIKNLILLGDAYKSIVFLGFQEEPAKIELLGQDHHHLEIGCAEFLIEDKSLLFIVGDTERNLEVFQYAPFNLQSMGGKNLVRRGDFHVGSEIRSMVKLPWLSRKDDGESMKRYFVLCGTLDGSVGINTPMAEKTFKRLQLLYSQLVNGLQHPAGLNPRAFRAPQFTDRLGLPKMRGVLDGDLLFRFSSMPLNRQREMTKHIGTNVERIMEDLVDLALGCDYF